MRIHVGQQLRFAVFREGVFQKMPPQNTEKHKTKLCAEVPERPLPKDPFFQLLSWALQAPEPRGDEITQNYAALIGAFFVLKFARSRALGRDSSTVS